MPFFSTAAQLNNTLSDVLLKHERNYIIIELEHAYTIYERMYVRTYVDMQTDRIPVELIMWGSLSLAQIKYGNLNYH